MEDETQGVEEEAREVAEAALRIIFDDADPILDARGQVNDLAQAKLLIHELSVHLGRLTENPAVALIFDPTEFTSAHILGAIGHWVSCPERTEGTDHHESPQENNTWSPSLPFQN